MNNKCVVCGKELAGGLDTYGDIHAPRCWDCFINDLAPEITQDDVDTVWREVERLLKEDER